MSTEHSPRGGYTAIELMIVLSIVSILSAMSAPSVVSAMRKAAITEGADIIAQVSTQARILAMRNQLTDDYYGVVVGVDDDGRGYAALTYGQDATPGTIMLAGSEPILRLNLKRTIMLTLDGAPMEAGTSIGWMHQYTTGAAISTPAQSADPISVGTPGSAICESLGVRSLDGRYSASIAMFPVGLTSFDVETP